jgi:predicted transcriptional regulator
MTDEVPPETAYALLASEPRVGIVRALGESDEPRSFTALKERVGIRDSGRFNYHLQRLVGTFVERTECGYVLTDDGERVVESIDG